MASNILKNNSFGSPTYFDRRWATCLGAVDKRAILGWPSSRGKGWPAICKSGPRLCSFMVPVHFMVTVLQVFILSELWQDLIRIDSSFSFFGFAVDPTGPCEARAPFRSPMPLSPIPRVSSLNVKVQIETHVNIQHRGPDKEWHCAVVLVFLPVTPVFTVVSPAFKAATRVRVLQCSRHE